MKDNESCVNATKVRIIEYYNYEIIIRQLQKDMRSLRLHEFYKKAANATNYLNCSYFSPLVNEQVHNH